ncbi:MAG: hypothetical protein ACEPOW_06275 [Bacteroidales bacterium]
MFKLGVASMSGSFKSIFVHGVLKGLGEQLQKIDVFAACSSSCIPMAYASCNELEKISLDYWIQCAKFKREGRSMSFVSKWSIKTMMSDLSEMLFDYDNPLLLISVSRVINEQAKLLTQTDQASRLGRKLLLDAAKNIEEWTKENLISEVYSRSDYFGKKYTPENIQDVFYSSSRMLHAWPEAGAIDGQAYIDGCYTEFCPITPLQNINCERVVAILTEPIPVKKNLTSSLPLIGKYMEHKTKIISPDFDLKEIGVDFASVSDDGLRIAFELGLEKGRQIRFDD